MKILAIANQKGGVGKTANLVHTAWYAAKIGKKVIVIDLDTQGNASDTLSHYLKANFPSSSALFQANIDLPSLPEEENIALISADIKLAAFTLEDARKYFGNFQENLKRLEKAGFDLCLIDTPPSLGAIMACALKASDFIVSPVEMETYSVIGIEKLIKTIHELKKEKNFLGLLPSKVDRRNPRHKREYEKLKGEKNVLDYPVILRSSIGDALAEKRPVWEIKKTSARQAAKEIQLSVTNIFKKMGM